MTNDITILPIGDLFVQQRTKDGMFNATSLLKQWNKHFGTKKSINDFLEEEKNFSLDFFGKEMSSHSQRDADGVWLDEIRFRNLLVSLSPEYGMIEFPCMLFENDMHEKLFMDFKKLHKGGENNTCTYILTDNSGLYKIGKSNNVKKRLSAFMVGNPSCKLVAIIPLDVESIFHEHFKDKRVTGEWFRLSESDLGEIMKFMESGELIWSRT